MWLSLPHICISVVYITVSSTLCVRGVQTLNTYLLCTVQRELWCGATSVPAHGDLRAWYHPLGAVAFSVDCATFPQCICGHLSSCRPRFFLIFLWLMPLWRMQVSGLASLFILRPSDHFDSGQVALLQSISQFSTQHHYRWAWGGGVCGAERVLSASLQICSTSCFIH